MRARSTVRRLGIAAALVAMVAVLGACDDPPTTASTPVAYSCDIKSNNTFVPNTTGSMTSHYAATAPQAVAPNAAFAVKIVPEPFTVDGSSTSDGTVTQVSSLVWRVAVPAGSTLTSQSISGWANVGSGTPTSTVSGSTVIVTVPGPIAANTTATLPTLTLNLKATGALGSHIEAKISGTSASSPGLTFNVRVTGTLVGTLNPSFLCYPNPSPVLHSTLISNDTQAPVIQVTGPTANQSIVQNATVLAHYTCDDGTGVGVASCVGTVANGAAINTSTLGAKTFTVTATDNEGKVAVANIPYTVVAPA